MITKVTYLMQLLCCMPEECIRENIRNGYYLFSSMFRLVRNHCFMPVCVYYMFAM